MENEATLPGKDVSRDRLTRLFSFLRELNQVRNPVKRQIREQAWVMWFRDLPNHSSIQRTSLEETDESEDAGGAPGPDADSLDSVQAGPVLKVTRPATMQAPGPPPSLVDWLERGWDDPFHKAIVRTTINDTDEQGETRIIAFADDPDREADFEQWRARRDEWAAKERPARQAMRIFDRLYELWVRIERESERLELVLGDGILTWRLPSGGLHHPILLKRVQLEFDPSEPSFIVSETERETELYSPLLRLAPDLDHRTISQVRTELDQGQYHPLGVDSTNGFLRSLVQRLSSRGQFKEDGAPREETDNPVMSRDLVLFLRERTMGYASMIEAILEDLGEREDLPEPLVSVVGIEHPSAISSSDQEPQVSTLPGEEPEEVLFSKPWNQEQVQIADRLERFGAVTVQGPPGTGKTHTIANLIGHLLATGQSVLVTAHTTKALRVLRDQVVEPLRPLCVSVLDNDLDSRKQLEDSVYHIVERLSQSHADQLEKQADQLEERRRFLLSKLRELRRQLLEARSGEYRDIVVNGESMSPAEAARKVAREQDKHAWIPGPVEPGAPLPLSLAEIAELYHSNAQVSAEDEQDLGVALPNLHELLTPEQWDSVLQQRAEAEQADRSYRADLWELGPTPDGQPALNNAAALLPKVTQWIAENERWQTTAAEAGFRGGAHREPWDRLLEEITEVVSRAVRFRETDIQHAPQFCTDVPLVEQQETFEQILRSIGADGKLGAFTALLHPRWRRLQQEARVSAGKPVTAEHFQALQEAIGLQIAREQLVRRWDYLVGGVGGPALADMGTAPELVGEQLAPALRSALNWAHQALLPLIDRLKAAGFRWEVMLHDIAPDPAADGELSRMIGACVEQLPPILSARSHAISWLHAEVIQDGLLQQLHTCADDAQTSTVVTRLVSAVTNLDGAAYRLAYLRLVDLHVRHQVLMRRRELLTRLEPVAPGWAAALRSRRALHGTDQLPGNVEAAWLWRQLHSELELRAAVSIQALQEEINRSTVSLQETTAELIERRSWAYQIRRTTLSQRQSLIGWLNIVRSIGKGFGKRVHRLRAEAAKAMNQARASIPVWIMPLSRVVDHFDPRFTRFDVVIVDEASQADPLGLAALYLGKRVVVVGDNEQVSPDAVGEQVERVEALIREYLQGIPNAVLYDGKRSIYDIAWESFGGGITLLEHFRCVPEIIQFSNGLSYDGRIRNLRESSGVHPKPHVVPYRVQGHSENKVNHEEALTVASLVVAGTEMPEYRNKTFGVISLVGEEQASVIDTYLRSALTLDAYMRHRVLCGTPPQFQGDERNVVFLTMVDGPNGNPPLALRQDDRFKRRFNVAASRARDQMWVLYSLDPQTDLKDGDLRRRLIEHALDPLATIRQRKNEERRVESEFERQVLKRLVSRGYRVRSQWPVGYYRIDLVVEGGGKRLAVECDGDRFHPIDKLGEDMARQGVLERLGWQFARIRGSQFFRNPDEALRPVFELLEQLEIPPEGAGVDGPGLDHQAEATEVLERIKTRAAAIRRDWRNQAFASEAPNPSLPETGSERRREAQGEPKALANEPKAATAELPVIDPLRPAPADAGATEQTTSLVRRPRGNRPGKVETRPTITAPLFGDVNDGRGNSQGRGRPHQNVTEPAAEHVPSSSQEDPVSWVASTKGDVWIRMTRWAKEEGVFEGWERRLLYSIGRYLENGWTVSIRQAQHAQRLYNSALEKGYRSWE